MIGLTPIFIPLLFLSASAVHAHGQDVGASQPPPVSAEDMSRPRLPGLVSHPPLDRVQRAMDKTNLRTLKLTIEVQWDADGRVTQASVQEKTSSASVERAALNWARGLRFEPGLPGKGLIPFRLRNDRKGGGNMPYFPGPGAGP